LWGLGVEDPNDIDLDAIAWMRGVRVRYRPLKGCEARIFGDQGRAIVSINSASSDPRNRFSLAHEIGHWELHRGKVLFCRKEDIGGDKGGSAVEKAANQFAANLLMPHYLFDGHRKGKVLTFGLVDEVAKAFRVSRTAAAIRLIDTAEKPAMLLCYSRVRREWFHRSPQWPEELWPRDELDTRSRAFDIQFGGKPDNRVMLKVPSDAWFERFAAAPYDIKESTVRGGNATTLTLIEVDKIHRR